MSLLFILFFFLFPSLTFIILQTTGFFLKKVGIVQFVVISLFLFGYLGTAPLFFGWDEYRIDTGVTNQFLVFKVMLFSGITMILFSLGAIFGKTSLNAPATFSKVNKIKINNKETLILILLFLIALLILGLYLSKIPRIALFVVFLENIHEANIARSVMGNDFSGKYHWYTLAIHDIANIITFSFFTTSLLKKKKLYRALFLLSFLMSFFTALIAIEKGPFAWLLIGLFLTHVLVKHKGIYPTKTLIIFSNILLLFISFSYMFFTGTNELGQAFLNLFSRAFAGSIQPAYHYLEFFSGHKDYLLGRSFPNPAGIFPYTPFELTKEIMNWVNPTDIKQGIIGSMPTIFWGEAYANYGYFGLACIPFLMGFIVYIIDYFISKIANSPLKIGFYVWLLLHYKDLAATGFTGFIIDTPLIVLVCGVIIIIGLSNKLKIKLTKIKHISYD
jgi:oligosaccharide repeat unit polymerase